MQVLMILDSIAAKAPNQMISSYVGKMPSLNVKCYQEN
jgi:hypothetical protein